MAITAFSGPLVQFGVTTTSSGGGVTGLDLEHNDQRGPALADLGDAMLDPRSAYNYDPGSGPSAKTFGLFNNVGSVDFQPSTLQSSAFVLTATPSSGVTSFVIAAS